MREHMAGSACRFGKIPAACTHTNSVNHTLSVRSASQQHDQYCSRAGLRRNMDNQASYGPQTIALSSVYSFWLLCWKFFTFSSLKKLMYRVSKITETMKWVFVLSSWTGQKCFITAELNPGNVSYIQICCFADVTDDFTTQEPRFCPGERSSETSCFRVLGNFVGINLLSQQKTPNKTLKIHTANWTLCSLSLLYSQLVLYSNNDEWMSDTW